jgi:hypothetical protein
MEAVGFSAPYPSSDCRAVSYEFAIAHLPWEVQQDRRSLSAWIDTGQVNTRRDRGPSSKQVALRRSWHGSSAARCLTNASRQGPDVEMDRRQQVTRHRP